MKTLIALLAVVALVASAAPAVAQTVVNPQKVEFTASADHATVIEGQAFVAKYELRVYLQGGTTVLVKQDLGKPAPAQTTNQISVPLALVGLPLSPTVKYIGVVYAMGPYGEAGSSASNPFMLVGPPAAPSNPVVSR